jgi:hypothetical protein
MARHRHARRNTLDNDTASAVFALARVERTCKALTEMLLTRRARAVYTGPKHPSARLSADHYGFTVVQ